MSHPPPQRPPSAQPRTFIPWGLFTGVFVPSALLSYPGVTLQAKLAWAVLVLFAGPKGRCRPRLKRLAARLGVTQRYARKTIAELRLAGFLHVTPSIGGANTYEFLEHPIFTAGAPGPRNASSYPPPEHLFLPPGTSGPTPYKVKRKLFRNTEQSAAAATTALVKTSELPAPAADAAAAAAASQTPEASEPPALALQQALIPTIPLLTLRAATKLWASCSDRLPTATVDEVTYFARVKWAEIQARGRTIHNPIALLVHTVWEFFDPPALSVLVHRKRLAELRLQELRAAADDAKALREQLLDQTLGAGERALIETCLSAAEATIAQLRS